MEIASEDIKNNPFLGDAALKNSIGCNGPKGKNNHQNNAVGSSQSQGDKDPIANSIENGEYPISKQLKELLEKLNINQKKLQNLLDIENLDQAANMNFYGKFLYYVMTAPFFLSLVRSFIIKPEHIYTELTNIPAEEHKILVDTENPEYLAEETTKKINIQNKDVYPLPNQPLLPKAHKKNSHCCFFTLHGVLMESEKRLKGIFAINAFYESSWTTFSRIWAGLVGSLIVQGITFHFIYPEEYGNSRWWDVLGFGAMANTLCIKAVDLFCVHTEYQYAAVLADALDSIYLWPFIAGLPLMLGTASAIKASRQTQPLDAQEIQDLIEKLDNYQGSFGSDTLGWIFSIAVPDALACVFPGLSLLGCIPQPEIKQALEKICTHLIWDGRLAPKDSVKLFNALATFSKEKKQITQMKALAMLADIIQGIDLENLVTLKEERYKQETLETLLYIKSRALKQLQDLSQYYLSDYPAHAFRSFPRFLFVNYLLWSSGYPKRYLPQLFYYPYKASKLFLFILFLRSSIINSIIDAINHHILKSQCENAGKIWLWFEELEQYVCSVCGDLPIFYRDIFTDEDCFRGYLLAPRTFEKLQIFINRSNLSNVSKLDISSQTIIVNQGYLPTLLEILKPKLINLKSFSLSGENLQEQSYFKYYKQIAEFIRFSSIEILVFREILDGYAYHFNDLIDTLPETNVTHLDFRGSTFVNPTFIVHLVDALKKSKVTHINFDGTRLFNYIKQNDTYFFEALPLTKITSLGLSLTGFGDSMCTILSKVLPDSRINELDISSNMVGGGDNCLRNLVYSIKKLNRTLEILNLQNIGMNEYSIKAFSENLHLLPIKKLFLGSYSGTSPTENIDRLLNALPNSSLQAFGLESSDYHNFPCLFSNIGNSNISDFRWRWFRSEFGDIGAKNLAYYSPKLYRLTYLDLTYNNIGSVGIQAIADALKNMNLIELILPSNNISSGFRLLANPLKNTKIKRIDIGGNKISDTDLTDFFEQLNQFKIERLDMNGNDITNSGLSKILANLPKSSIQSLNLRGNSLTCAGLNKMAAMLATSKNVHHSLWISNLINTPTKSSAFAKPSTNLTSLDISAIIPENITVLCNETIEAFCNVLPYTNISLANFSLISSDFLPANCGVISNANTLRPASPYVLLFRFFKDAHLSFSSLLYDNTKFLAIDRKNQNQDNNTYQQHSILKRFVLTAPTHKTFLAYITIEFASYQSKKPIFIDLNRKILLRDYRNDEPIYIPENIIAVRGSVHCNNFIIFGCKKTFLDMNQAHGKNLLAPGNNNHIRLDAQSQDHIVLNQNQGTIKIYNFGKEGYLYVMNSQSNYLQNYTIFCNNTISNNLSTPIIHWDETTIELLEMRCEDIENNIHINDLDAFEKALTEVIDSADNASSLYTGLLSMCETFLHSINQSAWLTAIPAFASEVLYRFGGYTRAEVEKFAQEIQKLLLVSITNSPHTVAASLLARCLASRLTHSPQIISTLAIAAGIVSSVMESALTTNVSFGWIVLQTGVALMGSVAGSLSIQKLPDVGRWGLNNANRAKNYLSSSMGFWQQAPTDIEHSQNVSGQVVITNNRPRNF